MVVSIDSLRLHNEELWRKQGSEKEYIRRALTKCGIGKVETAISFYM
jgi:hypothetical protein